MTAMNNLFYRKDKKRLDARSLVRHLLNKRRLMFTLIVGVPLLLYVVFGNKGIIQRIRLQNEKVELEEKIRAAEAETRELQSQSKALDGDKKAIEKVAREKHAMVREGENVYKVSPEQ